MLSLLSSLMLLFCHSNSLVEFYMLALQILQKFHSCHLSQLIKILIIELMFGCWKVVIITKDYTNRQLLDLEFSQWDRKTRYSGDIVMYSWAAVN